MAGGKGQRLRIKGVEKPLLEYQGKPLFAHVYTALERSKISSTIVVTSPYTPRTTRLAKIANMRVAEAPGDGYIGDYRWIITRLRMDEPVLIVAADLPLLTSQIVDKIVDYFAASKKSALAVYLPQELCDAAGYTCDFVLHAHQQTLVPAAVNVVDGRHITEAQEEAILVVDDEALLYNINTIADLKRLIKNSVA
ncbi:MAG: NTP transferase domain-containing protein [Halobacteriota archaeon]